MMKKHYTDAEEFTSASAKEELKHMGTSEAKAELRRLKDQPEIESLDGLAEIVKYLGEDCIIRIAITSNGAARLMSLHTLADIGCEDDLEETMPVLKGIRLPAKEPISQTVEDSMPDYFG